MRAIASFTKWSSPVPCSRAPQKHYHLCSNRHRLPCFDPPPSLYLSPAKEMSCRRSVPATLLLLRQQRGRNHKLSLFGGEGGGTIVPLWLSCRTCGGSQFADMPVVSESGCSGGRGFCSCRTRGERRRRREHINDAPKGKFYFIFYYIAAIIKYIMFLNVFS